MGANLATIQSAEENAFLNGKHFGKKHCVHRCIEKLTTNCTMERPLRLQLGAKIIKRTLSSDNYGREEILKVRLA